MTIEVDNIGIELLKQRKLDFTYHFSDTQLPLLLHNTFSTGFTYHRISFDHEQLKAALQTIKGIWHRTISHNDNDRANSKPNKK